MRKWRTAFLSILLVFSLSACGQAKNSSEENQNSTKGDSHVLIAYFAVPEDKKTSDNDAIAGASIVVKNSEKMGNTEYVAGLVQKTIGGDLFRIETKDTYPLEHDALVDQAAEEQEKKLRPELSSHIENLEQYDTVILGYPIWWYTMPQAMFTFLEEYDFAGKTVIPFATHGGYGVGSSVEDIQKLCLNANVVEDIFEAERDDISKKTEEIGSWIEKLGL